MTQSRRTRGPESRAPTPEEGRRAAARLRARFLATIAAIAGLLLLDQGIVQPALMRLDADAPALNVAGRQRMLSQRLAKAALMLDRGDGPASHNELAEVLALWLRSHRELRRGGLGPSGEGGAAAALEALDPVVGRIAEAAGRLLEPPEAGPKARAPALGTILEAEPAFLGRMDAVVGLYEAEARARVAGLRALGWALAGLSLAALAGLGAFVLAPAVALIGRQVDGLAEARERLEGRVRERTAELERANARLAAEAEERRRAEEQHRRLREQIGRAARADAVGVLASGLAHELNQPLGAVANYVEGCLVALEAPGPPMAEVREALGRARDAALRAGRIVGRVRGLVARREPAVEAVDPAALAREVAALSADEVRRRGAALELVVAPRLPLVQADPVQVQQVLVNLLANALDAVSGLQAVSALIVMEVRGGAEGGVEYLVRDGGRGIEPDLLDRVFDPFFSTRADGMGMGLAICRAIAEAHGGRIVVEGEPGVGTTFRFTLPAPADAEPPADHDADEPADGLHRGR